MKEQHEEMLRFLSGKESDDLWNRGCSDPPMIARSSRVLKVGRARSSIVKIRQSDGKKIPKIRERLLTPTTARSATATSSTFVLSDEM